MARINITLICRTPLNIGSGAQQGTLADRSMLKDAEGKPYVPATAFKGRLRHAVEQVAETLNLKPTTCITHQSLCGRCLICHLFGAPQQAGHLRFTTLKLTAPPELSEKTTQMPKVSIPRTTHRTGVSLNRRRGVAEDDHLFSTEIFLPGMPLEFSGHMAGDISEAEAGLLVAGLQLLPALGRGKTGGLGWIETHVTIDQVDEPDKWQPSVLLKALQQMTQQRGI